jgi:Right handed beta helix region
VNRLVRGRGQGLASLTMWLIVALVLLAAFPATAAAQQPACGDVITQDTTLTADVRCDLVEPEQMPDAGLAIGADGVTLDLGAFRVVGGVDVPATGIHNDGYDAVTIRNGTIDGFGDLIRLDGVERNRLVRLTGDAHGRGVVLTDTRLSELRHLSLWGTAGGSLYLVRSTENLVADTQLRGRQIGAVLTDSHLNRFVRTEIRGESGLSLSTSHFNRITNSSVSGSFFGGASVNGWYNTFARTRFYSGDPFGDDQALSLIGSHNTVHDSTFTGPSYPRFEVISGAENVIRRNELVGFGPSDYFPADGLLIHAAAVNTKLVDNFAHDFADDGIDAESPSTILRYNRANDNGDYGIEAVPGVTGTGNTATGNGNPAQCLNVACN